ncbi:hypothetical protein EDB89DRAFT_415295 [Lactarius sanguifluus]|nr:hypothetical protein EDB89DRAFT_415295 [Lactarius sanguifluus]
MIPKAIRTHWRSFLERPCAHVCTCGGLYFVYIYVRWKDRRESGVSPEIGCCSVPGMGVKLIRQVIRHFRGAWAPVALCFWVLLFEGMAWEWGRRGAGQGRKWQVTGIKKQRRFRLEGRGKDRLRESQVRSRKGILVIGPWRIWSRKGISA